MSIGSPLLLLICWRIGHARIHVSAPCINWVEPVIGLSSIERRYAQKRSSFYTVPGVTV
jgi:hypothetical protein